MSEIRKCVKCINRATLCGVDVKKAAYCKACFIQMVKHKFSSAIGKRRLYKDGERRETLIVYDGTNAGAFLLSVVSQGLRADAHKRLTLIPTVMVLFKETDESVIDILKNEIEVIKECIPCSWIYVHIAAVFSNDIHDPRISSDVCGIEQIPKWTQLLASCASESVREELKRLCLTLICVRIAQNLKINKVMLPVSADELAQTTLSLFAFARGPSVYYSANVVDKSCGTVTVIRPLREITEKEMALVNRFEESDRYILNVQRTNGAKIMEGEPSLQTVTRDFISGLTAKGFTGSVTTILSTANKLQSPAGSRNRCALCFGTYAAVNEDERYCFSCTSILDEISDKRLLDELLLNCNTMKH